MTKKLSLLFWQVPKDCSSGIVSSSQDCCSSGVVASDGHCCSAGSVLDGNGLCCPSGTLDACGVCDGTSKFQDVQGVCCSSVVDAAGVCCKVDTAYPPKFLLQFWQACLNNVDNGGC